MKRGRVFVVGHTEGTLMPMDETAYASEDLLQQLLADYPDLLPGNQINPQAPGQSRPTCRRFSLWSRN
jgi:hypothetical protein